MVEAGTMRASLPLDRQCQLAGLEAPTLELRFAPPRRWRFDLAWESVRLAVEIEGGVFLKGGSRHSRGAGFEGDCEKYAEAMLLGWKVLRVTTGMVRDGRALNYIERLLRGNRL
jgi:very-short-patch-repair endonuclease